VKPCSRDTEKPCGYRVEVPQHKYKSLFYLARIRFSIYQRIMKAKIVLHGKVYVDAPKHNCRKCHKLKARSFVFQRTF